MASPRVLPVSFSLLLMSFPVLAQGLTYGTGRGLWADGVSAVHQRRDPRRPGPRPAESPGSKDAAWRQIREAPGVEAADATAKGLPLLAVGLRPSLQLKRCAVTPVVPGGVSEHLGIPTGPRTQPLGPS